MQRNAVETLLGAVVIIIAAGFIFFFQEIGHFSSADGYTLHAKFSKIDGINRGSPVRISGVNVGKVTDFSLDPETYSAIVTMQIDEGIEIPYDTAAVISSEGLLGGKFLSLEPGADVEMMVEGDTIEFTQSTPGIEALLGQAIYSFSNKKDSSSSETASSDNQDTNVAIDEPSQTED